jgi:hypothetical protein
MRRNGEAQAYVDCPLSWVGGDMRYRTIIVGTDGSESALKAVEQAAEIAGARSARLLVVCV